MIVDRSISQTKRPPISRRSFRYSGSIPLHRGTYTDVGTIEEQTHNHEYACTGYCCYNPQRDSSTSRHSFFLLTYLYDLLQLYQIRLIDHGKKGSPPAPLNKLNKGGAKIPPSFPGGARKRKGARGDREVRAITQRRY